MAMEKCMLQEVTLQHPCMWIKPCLSTVPVGVDKTMAQQVSEEISEGSEAKGTGHATAGTPQCDCGCGH